MGNQLLIPKPQHRYLEPYKNRVFQYDTKHSNYFLSHYVNQLLNVVGNDTIVRGLEVTPVIDTYKTGVKFEISPGALVQDLTYFEFPTANVIEMDNLVSFNNYWVVICTNWRYIETPYDNPLKIEATLYNPTTRKTISGWSNYTNRIILGVFSYSVTDGEISFINEEEGDIFFEDANISQNGTFDDGSFKFWTAFNSTLKVLDSGGVADTSYLHITPLSGPSQGVGQILQTKTGYNYEVSFYLRADTLLPFQAKVLDGTSLYDANAPEITTFTTVTPQNWTQYSFQFQAISNNTTLLLLKTNEDTTETFDVDSVYCLEYLENKKQTDINRIKIIDGGELEPIAGPGGTPGGADKRREVLFQNWNLAAVPGQQEYFLNNFISTEQMYPIVFYDSDRLVEDDYSVNPMGLLRLNFEPTDPEAEITTYVIGCNKINSQLVTDWEFFTRPGVQIYELGSRQLKNPDNGRYFVFYGSNFLSPLDYTINFLENTITFRNNLVESPTQVTIIYIDSSDYVTLYTREWEVPLSMSTNVYTLTGGIGLSDFPGFYLVFYDGNKLSEQDYTIENSGIRLSFTPGVPGGKLMVYYIGDTKDASEQ